MKNILRWALAALAACALIPSPATAGEFYMKHVALQFVRFSSASDNPTPQAIPYTSGFSNGYHGNNLGVALALQDTSAAIDVRDHVLFGSGALRVWPGVIAADSSLFGSLIIKTLPGGTTVDTLVIQRDFSMDGVTWTVADSIGAHMLGDRAQVVTGAVSDSAIFIANTITDPIRGNVTGYLGTGWTVSPWMGKAGVTAQCLQGVNFVRFRLRMQPGDFVNAGSTGGFSAEFVYPAQDAGYVR